MELAQPGFFYANQRRISGINAGVGVLHCSYFKGAALRRARSFTPIGQTAVIGATIIKNSRFFVLLLLAIIVVLALYFFRQVVLPFGVAAFLAYLIAPIIEKLSSMKVRGHLVHRALSIIIVYTVALSIITLTGFYLIPKLSTEVNRLVRELPTILRNLEETVVQPMDTRINSWLAEFVSIPKIGEKSTLPLPDHKQHGESTDKGETGETGPVIAQNGNGAITKLVEDYTYVVRRLDEDQFEVIPRKRVKGLPEEEVKNFDFNRQIGTVFGQFRSHFESNFVELLRTSRTYVLGVLGSFFTTFLVLMISAFILIDPHRMIDFLCSLVPDRHHGAFDRLIAALDRGLSGVVRGQVLICLINGSLTGIGIAIIGVPFVFSLTLIATVFSLIPIFGVLISTIPIILIALTVSFSTALLALAWVLVIHFIEGNFLNPKVLGASSKIHPVFIIFALVVGQYMGGIMGALLAVPAFSLLQNSFLFLKGLAEEVEAAA